MPTVSSAPAMAANRGYRDNAAGALSGRFTDIGIDDSFMKEAAGTLTPGQACPGTGALTATRSRTTSGSSIQRSSGLSCEQGIPIW